MKQKAVVFTRDFERFEEKLTEMNLPGLEFEVPRTDEEKQEAIKGATIFLGIPYLIKDYINQAVEVKWVQSTFAGIDALTDPSLRKDYVLTNVKDVYGEAMAEFVFAYLLAFEKEIFTYRDFQKQKQWDQKSMSRIEEKTILVLGTGSIGSRIGKLAKAFGMRVLGYKNTKSQVDYFDETYAGDELLSALGEADFVVNVLPSTKATKDIISTYAFDAMKNSAVFVNVGRGSAVDEDALVVAIKEKKIAQAVLDVFKSEPLPKESPFWGLENVYVTPHISGYIESEKFFDIFAENYKRFVEGEDLHFKVDLEKGY